MILKTKFHKSKFICKNDKSSIHILFKKLFYLNHAYTIPRIFMFEVVYSMYKCGLDKISLCKIELFRYKLK